SCAVDLEVTCPGSLFRCDPFWGCYKFCIDLVPESTPVAMSGYRLAPLEMQELSEQLQELQDKVQSKAFKQDNVPWVGSERDEAYASRSPVLWVEIRESSLTGLELVQETTDKIKVDKTLRFVEEPVENSDREVKRLKCSRMVVVKVHLGSKRGL
ncbi:hypothetical protein Tco_1578575, partial [Tanacetum coccineum]